MKNDEIRAANRKALPKFLLFTLVCAVIGGIAGYCAARYGLDQLSGDHAKIKAWRRIESLRATKRHRPDLLASAELTDKEKRLLEEL